MLEIFIRRPVLATVISVLITFVGLLALVKLPITQFPSIEPPSVTVTANYTGANAEVCAKTVATPLERAINGVPGMTYMSSVCSNNGITLIQVFFESGTDPDLATVNVQNRVTSVLDELPEEVIKAGVITEKEVSSMLMYLNITSSDSTQDEKFVYNFTDINVLQELKRINGVGFVEIMGARDYAMRIWLKPDRMAAYDISAQDIVDAVQNQNIEAAPGATGISSDKEPQILQYVLRYTGKFTTEEDYGKVAVKSGADGAIVRIRDVADIEFGSLDYDMISTTDGHPSASIMIKQRPGSNAREVIQNIKARMGELKESSFPPGMEYSISYDVSRFLDTSIHEVVRTLIEAFLLVSIVVFIFLQDFRSTLIPAIAVPVSLIGTFFFMDLFGFSINLLTLFALVLAIGIVVDNAIVVVEAVHVKMHEQKLSATDATIAAMKEIAGAIIAITLVMSAVFIPVGFMTGPIGVFYRQFSLTLAIAIVISGVNALTLSPALCALMLRPSSASAKRSWLSRFFAAFNSGYGRLERGYAALLARLAGRRLVITGMLVFFVLATVFLNGLLPTSFIPTEDQGMIYANVTLPAGATVERTQAVLEALQKVTQSQDAVESVSTLAGYSLMTESAGASYGMVMINLKPWDTRQTSVNALIDSLQQKASSIADADVQFFPPPAVPGFGNASGFELRLQDRTGGPLSTTAEVTDKFIAALNARPEIQNTFTSFDPDFPQYLLRMDYDKATKLGISVKNAMESLQTLVGSFYASNFIRFGQMYKVMVQTGPGFRSDPRDILKLYVKNDRGEMVALSSFITLEPTNGPEQLTRYNMFTSSMINGEPAPGYSSGDAIAAVGATAAEALPRGFTYDWSGVSREEIKSGNQTLIIFMVCLFFVYLLLSAQYESYLLPLSIILSLPAGIVGSYLFLLMAGLENNIYAQVALVMLIGLLGKNAILIVEFAIQRRNEGHTILKAAVAGAATRLRPILMTSLAFVAGLIPLCIASGAGAIGNRSIGMAAAGGMILGTLFGIILVPGLYVIFETFATYLRTRGKSTSASLSHPNSVI
jgi:hydrophobic/amphiphilic exporter-1 (mainly G- bacteria), HAE1 family